MAPVIINASGNAVSSAPQLPHSVRDIIAASGRFDPKLAEESIAYQWAHFEINRAELTGAILSDLSSIEIHEKATIVGGELLFMLTHTTGLKNGEAILGILKARAEANLHVANFLDWSLRLGVITHDAVSILPLMQPVSSDEGVINLKTMLAESLIDAVVCVVALLETITGELK